MTIVSSESKPATRFHCECGGASDADHRPSCPRRGRGMYRSARTTCDPRFIDGVYDGLGMQPVRPPIPKMVSFTDEGSRFERIEGEIVVKEA